MSTHCHKVNHKFCNAHKYMNKQQYEFHGKKI